MARETKIPGATIERMALYVRPLEKLLEEGLAVVSSRKLALLCRVRSAQVRKDLSYFGEMGVRGVGYDVRDLLREIRRILGLDREWRLAIVGLGSMGRALLHDPGLVTRFHRLVAAFDSDPEKVGAPVYPGLIVQPATSITRVCREEGIHIGVIAVPSSQAQNVADRLFEGGVRAFLNFSPFHIRNPGTCHVENVDFAVSLDKLAYFLGDL